MPAVELGIKLLKFIKNIKFGARTMRWSCCFIEPFWCGAHQYKPAPMGQNKAKAARRGGMQLKLSQFVGLKREGRILKIVQNVVAATAWPSSGGRQAVPVKRCPPRGGRHDEAVD